MQELTDLIEATRALRDLVRQQRTEIDQLREQLGQWQALHAAAVRRYTVAKLRADLLAMTLETAKAEIK